MRPSFLYFLPGALLFALAACGEFDPDDEWNDETWQAESEHALTVDFVDPPTDEPVSFERRRPDNQTCSLASQTVQTRMNIMCVACGVSSGTDFTAQVQGEGQEFGGGGDSALCQASRQALFAAMDECFTKCDYPAAELCTPDGC